MAMRHTSKTQSLKRGDILTCDEEGCGVEIEIRKGMSHLEECDIVCCGQPMQRKGGRSC